MEGTILNSDHFVNTVQKKIEKVYLQNRALERKDLGPVIFGM